VSLTHLPVPEVLITRGSEGAVYRSGGKEIAVPAFVVKAVDTTGAGDTYLGFFVAGLDAGMDVKGAMTFAAAGAAIQVTRPGTADAIPGLTEVKAFLEERLINS
jgi:ribokinase